MRHLSEKLLSRLRCCFGHVFRGGQASAGLQSAVDPLTYRRAGSFFMGPIIYSRAGR